jgi:DNA replication protein DnaC
MKTPDEFESRRPQIPEAKIRELAEGGYSTRAEPVVLIGECGTGKTHLATGLCVAACPKVRVNAGVLQRSVAARCGLYLYREAFGLDVEMA